MTASAQVRYERKRMELILTLNPRIFKICEGTMQEVWCAWKLRTDKWLVHLKEDGRWNVKRLD